MIRVSRPKAFWSGLIDLEIGIAERRRAIVQRVEPA